MTGKKGALLAVLKVLEKYSDRQNPLTQQQIIDLVKQDFNVELERKSIADTLRILADDFDYDINKKDGNKGFFLDQRLFEPSEVTFLTNSILTAKQIKGGFAKKLSNKVLSVLSDKYKANYKTIHYCDDIDREEGSNFFNNIDLISHAIRHNHKITYKYLTYDDNGNLIPKKRSDGSTSYKVSPYYIINSRGICYMLCKLSSNDKKKIDSLATYRIEYMDEILETKETSDDIKTISSYKNGFNLSNYLNNHIYMFGNDNPILVKLLIKNTNAIKYIKEWFGKNAKFSKSNNKQYATFKTDSNTFFFWIMQYSEHFILLEPKELVNKVKLAAKNIIENY